MKKLLFIFSCILLLSNGCDDDGFLKETPQDFLTTDNSFLNYAQFKTGLNALYVNVRSNFVNADNAEELYPFGLGTDLTFRPLSIDAPFTNWTYISPSLTIINTMYSRQYSLIYSANNILSQSESPDVKWNSEEEKLSIQAEARFFRAFAYRYLSEMFGGVPIIDKVVVVPSLGYTRNTRAEVYQFCVDDFKFAAENLPVSTTEPGRLVKAAAYHFLSEMYIALGDEAGDNNNYTLAVDAASQVLSGSAGDYHLMTARYGWRKDVAGKNVYWDLFQMKSASSQSNFNYQSGNFEAVWVIQIDKFATGGLPVGTGLLTTRTNQERGYWPAFWGQKKFGYDGNARDWMGRGISWARPTNYFNYTVWQDSGPNDMRNNEVNITRNFYAPPALVNGKEDPAASATYTDEVTLANGNKITVTLHPGDLIKKEWLTTAADTMERFFPRVVKMGSDWHYAGDPANGFAKEFYAIRLPETYLLRAEAYLKLGQTGKAADDVNVIRARAGANLADAADMDIDYILDERARELYGEEFRALTLCRLGKLYDRTNRYGYVVSQNTVEEKNNLFPIPQPVIDANSQAEFTQNPKY